MPSHQNRREPLPKDYQFPTPRRELLAFHPKAFEWLWELKPLTPEEHVHAFRKMMDEWYAREGGMHS